jgi:hypothetical protein
MPLESQLPRSICSTVPQAVVLRPPELPRTSSQHDVDTACVSDLRLLAPAHLRCLSAPLYPEFPIPRGHDSRNIGCHREEHQHGIPSSMHLYTARFAREQGTERHNPRIRGCRQECPCHFLGNRSLRRHRLSTDPLCTRRAASTHRRSGIGIWLMVAMDLDFSIWVWVLCNRKVGDVEACWSRRTQQVARSHPVCAGRPALAIHGSTGCAPHNEGQRVHTHPGNCCDKWSKPGRALFPKRILKSRRKNFAVRRNI